MDLMVPKGGFEPPRVLPTTPSRWRVYQFHHFGILISYRSVPTLSERTSFAPSKCLPARSVSAKAGGRYEFTSSAQVEEFEVEPEPSGVLPEPSEPASLL